MRMTERGVQFLWGFAVTPLRQSHFMSSSSESYCATATHPRVPSLGPKGPIHLVPPRGGFLLNLLLTHYIPWVRVDFSVMVTSTKSLAIKVLRLWPTANRFSSEAVSFT